MNTYTEKNPIAFDTETELMSYENPVPDLICLTHAVSGDLRGKLLTPWEQQIDILLMGWFLNDEHTVGHNISYDLSILTFKYPDLLPYIFRALDKGTIHDTLLREKLLNITKHGSIDMITFNGANIRLGYSQADLEKKYLNIDRSDLKDAEDAPRLNYAMYKDVPAVKWDEQWVSYAIDDAVNAGLIYQYQEEQRKECIEMHGYDPFVTEKYQVRKAFALRLIECVGSLLDGDKVKEVTKEYETEYNKPELRNPLIKAGLLLEAIPETPFANGALDHLISCPGHKEHPEYKKSNKVSDCGCPPKMKKAVPEKSPTKPLHQYIWNLAQTNPEIKAWPSDSTVSSLKQAGVYDDVISGGCFKKSVIASTEIEQAIADEFDALRIASETKEKVEIANHNHRIKVLSEYQNQGFTVLLPDDISLSVNEEWRSNYTALDPLLSLWDERKRLQKIITDYLPKMHYDDGSGNLVPAKIIRCGYNPLVLTGRSSGRTSSMYPSRNDQNVDPRVRPCTIPRPGNVIISTDYNGMELGTLAQKCVNLFGASELANKINAGIDTHAFLAAQIAFAMDKEFQQIVLNIHDNQNIHPDIIYDDFAQLKNVKESCESELKEFTQIYKGLYPDLDRPVMWSDFFNHYRTLAKPTGLGYPGGLGPATMISYAKATFGLTLTFPVAKNLREIWLETYPEMGMYLEYVSKECQDPNHGSETYVDDDGNEQQRVFYCYDTPRGMHRARCSFCEAANGQALQAFSAEGALEGLYQVTKYMWLADYDDGILAQVLPGFQRIPELSGCFIIAFIHDELLWECPNTSKMGEKARIVEAILVDCMQEITPNVKAGASSAAMHRWYKKAEPIWDGNKLIPWEPETK